MAGRRLDKGARQYVKRSRKQYVQEQRIREEIFNAVAGTDPQFNRIAHSLSK
jgi:hypothetical protein